MKLTHNCPKCNKPAKIQSEFPIGDLIGYTYQCGHFEIKQKINLIQENEGSNIGDSVNRTASNTSNSKTQVLTEIKAPEPTQKELYEDLDRWAADGGAIKETNLRPKPDYVPLSYYSVDLKACSYPYQIDGVKFAESTELNCLFADAMGVGKTIQALISIKRNKQITQPCIIIVKGSTAFQWASEFHKWFSKYLGDCIVVTKRSLLIPGFSNYIVSMDMLAKPDFVDSLIELKPKSVILDEVQNFKEPSAKRTIGLIRLIKHANIKYKLALSGTPIKNRPEEYFTILNILAPSYFRDLSDFKKEWLSPLFDEKGKLKGYRFNPLRINRFQELISRWVIRRERHDVLKDLPPLTRDYQLIEITDPNIRNSYNHTLDLFKNWLKSNVNGVTSQALLGWLAQLRALTGQAKCVNAIEWLNDFLESTDESIAVGINHHSVRDTLYLILEQNQIPVLKLSGEDNVYRKNDIVRQFTNGDKRVLIINSIAGGVGLNLQTCANALVLERQWNSADEEQFEARFHRDGQQKAVTVTYMIAKGTIDEFFHDMVLRKKKVIADGGIGSSLNFEGDIDSLKDLANLVVNNKI